ncbi:matrilysin-like [Frankliniella occidentalis]|uniref:Matrilysin-like n=1 Tax=Frankliniella occidentalis TaxID=133901 RepID=A0A9C6XAG9_FRAOC|nr:matrilysin-like [Frankliniella occidentalis]
MALEVWARPANLSFAEDNKSPDIEVRFERGNHHDGFDFDGRGNILAHAFYPGTGLGGDVHLDWDERWLAQTNNPSNGRGGKYMQTYCSLPESGGVLVNRGVAEMPAAPF